MVVYGKLNLKIGATNLLFTFTTLDPMLNYDAFENQVEDYAQKFHQARPCPHLVIDNFLEPAIAQKAFEVFPDLDSMDMLKDFRQKKAQDPAINKFDALFPAIIFQHLHSPRLLNWLTQVTGIPNLLADEKLYAAGLAQSGHGGFLNVHIDNSSHPVHPWYRRLNILIYLNPHWTEEKGGHLELWSPDMSDAVAILPTFNRMVLFATNRQSWHRHRYVNTPDGDTRKSINIYYFTEQSPDGTDYYHITTFKARKWETLHKVLYPVDNLMRSMARKLRSRKDTHAVLYDQQNHQ